MLKRKIMLFCVVSVAALGMSAAPVRADLFGFMPISHNAGATADAVTAQLSLDVSASGPYIAFTFTNNLAPGPVVVNPVQSSITGTWFDDRAGALSSLAGIINGPGVSFAPGGNPTNLPSANNVTPPFAADFWATATSGPGGVAAHGVNEGPPGEYVIIAFSGASLADVLAALYAGAGDPTASTGTLRVGIHVQQLINPDTGGITSDASDAFVLTPVPGALILGALGLGVAGLRLRRWA